MPLKTPFLQTALPFFPQRYLCWCRVPWVTSGTTTFAKEGQWYSTWTNLVTIQDGSNPCLHPVTKQT